ncbi:transcriptional regulator, LysR family [Syntrophobotulus glycolicus DSM 8271]|uniref:Transcriptional regulator, LysR family n=1 Tax=Syntrophobotulus glycolicus (strain DSM 8271 / FlGlyR) TaxID=645991 RepID=F0T0E7_SYNGF|nr:LysR family transcriptional regulator [Syntrophobotulus glycolicus]ADY57319.1 transcriptional regulator, LysR family [Syntrophobotulus glycolicus DSM 8271]
MDLLQLKYFQVVARTEHMTKAARELQIAQPALSVTIARLEEDLGVPLFDRQNRRIVLNPYGRAFLRRVDTALAALGEGRQELADLAGMEYGILSIATTFLDEDFSKMIGSFVSRHPSMRFRIRQLSEDKTKLQLLTAGEVDFGFINQTVQGPDIASVALLSEELLLAAPPGHPFGGCRTVSLSDLAPESFVLLKEGHSIRKRCDELFEKAGFFPKVVCECDEIGAIRNLVHAGLGISFLPEPSSQAAAFPLTFVKNKELTYRNTLFLAWNEKRYLSKAALKFREYVVRYYT